MHPLTYPDIHNTHTSILLGDTGRVIAEFWVVGVCEPNKGKMYSQCRHPRGRHRVRLERSKDKNGSEYKEEGKGLNKSHFKLVSCHHSPTQRQTSSVQCAKLYPSAYSLLSKTLATVVQIVPLCILACAYTHHTPHIHTPTHTHTLITHHTYTHPHTTHTLITHHTYTHCTSHIHTPTHHTYTHHTPPIHTPTKLMCNRL